ncbi:hypothetical protein TRIUR3_23894 [Triticum urartu]|uniref:Uncharacterized protein n=1 Tax=Triticum urartu TaxID=4572 RepID=M7ZG43_TRIUA|nr:hypothetical protein TRIUR3_23894 [Triticum urartu]
MGADIENPILMVAPQWCPAGTPSEFLKVPVATPAPSPLGRLSSFGVAAPLKVWSPAAAAGRGGDPCIAALAPCLSGIVLSSSKGRTCRIHPAADGCGSPESHGRRSGAAADDRGRGREDLGVILRASRHDSFDREVERGMAELLDNVAFLGMSVGRDGDDGGGERESGASSVHARSTLQWIWCMPVPSPGIREAEDLVRASVVAFPEPSELVVLRWLQGRPSSLFASARVFLEVVMSPSASPAAPGIDVCA